MIWFDYKFDWFDHLFDQICQSGPCLQEDSAKGLWVKASVWITSSSHVMLCDVLICYVYIMQCYLWFYYFAFSMLVNRCMTCYDFLYYIFDYYILLLPSFEIIIHIICIYIYIEFYLYSLLGKSQAQHDVHSTLSGSYSIRCAWAPADYWRTSCSIHSHDPWTFMFTQVVLFWMSLHGPPQTSPLVDFSTVQAFLEDRPGPSSQRYANPVLLWFAFIPLPWDFGVPGWCLRSCNSIGCSKRMDVL